MPPPLQYGAASHGRLLRAVSRRDYSSSCLLCMVSRSSDHRPSLSRKRVQHPPPQNVSFQVQSTRQSSNGTSEARTHAPSTVMLKSALLGVQSHAGSYTNISRLQLALRGLEQGAGQETIRIAVLGLAGQEQAARKVKELVRLLVADPLKEEEEWERELLAEQRGDRPVLLKIGDGQDRDADAMSGIRFSSSNALLRELNVSSPTLKEHRLEILILRTGDFSMLAEQSNLTNSILVPTVEIPVSNTGRYTPVTTPVHKAIVVGDGVIGAASLIRLSEYIDPEVIISTVDFSGQTLKTEETLPFQMIDLALAKQALYSFRESVDNAISYEHDWFNSNLPVLLEWLKAGTNDSRERTAMKPSVYLLISNLLTDANQRIQIEESRQLSALLSSKVPSSALQGLRSGLETWAERAHTELRDQLETAFAGHRWRKLGWWKLFWRVDDVSMIASDVLNQRLLPEAEKEIIYLAGRIEQAGVFNPLPTAQPPSNWAYKPEAITTRLAELGSTPPSLQLSDLIDKPNEESSHIPALTPQPWPLHIPTTRTYLSLDTIPALQALAQKLVFETLATSGFGFAFSALIYVSTLSTSLYEAGAVAAFGVVWSLRRMQKKWETARTYWEDEVKEEGRKAVRAVEASVDQVLREPDVGSIAGREEIEEAKRAVARAEVALKGVRIA
ncbi:MAG: hypothetical protein M1818_002316 [Claussenomyces sp. TS43310]|nr:MAG: hypothetical protein M1818_002316 [Claussenomyces sp. TS43310]